MSGINSWVFTVRRESTEDTAKLVQELLGQAVPEKSLDLLKLLYERSYQLDPTLAGSAAESALVRAQQQLFVNAGSAPDFIACAMWSWRHDWQDLKTLLAVVLDGTNREVSKAATVQLVVQLQTLVHSTERTELPHDLLEWFWTRLVACANLDFLEYDESWRLGEIVKKLGRVPASSIVDAVETRLSLCDTDDRHDIDSPSRLLPLVEPVGTHNAEDPAIQGAIDALASMLTRSAYTRHWIPKLLARLDPQGLIAPCLLATRLEVETDPKGIRSLARAACFYGVNSGPWRQIARAAIEASRLATNEEREEIYWSIAETGNRSYSSAVGEVASIFTNAVEAAEKGRADEQEATFRDFWKWRLHRAQLELRHEEERAKEDVWE